MPQEPSRGGLDDAAEEEVKTFRTEGDGEERVIENGPASVQDSYGFANPDDLNDVKSSLVIEGDPTSLKGANSQVIVLCRSKAVFLKYEMYYK